MLLLTATTLLHADYVFSYSLSGGGRSANAVFTQSYTGSEYRLSINLTNTSQATTSVPTDVLTALFWHTTQSMDLSRISAKTDPASILQRSFSNYGKTGYETNTALINAGNVSCEYAYKTGAGLGGISGLTFGVSSSGLSEPPNELFGPHDRFDTVNNLEGPDSPDGIQYGLLTAGGLDANANGGLDHTLVQNSVTMLFKITSGWAGSQSAFDNLFDNIRFQYGTALDEPYIGYGQSAPPVPVPAGFVLFGIGGGIMAAGTYLRRRRSIKQA